MSILKKLTIENFKGIGQKVSFDFKPITLFFGQNSAGKSTVLHALNYLHDILNLHTINADNTSLGHGSIDLGGFKHFVHKHDLQRTINLSLEIDMTSQDLIETDSANLFNELQRLFPGEFVHGELIDLSHISNRIETSKIDIEIAWSDLLKKPYVKSLSIAFNDEPILKVVSSSTCARIEITQINLSHSIFLGTESDDEVIYLYPLIENIIQERYLSPDNSDTVILDELNIDELDLYPPDSPHKKNKLNDNALIGLEGMQDALPERGYNLKLQDIWEEQAWIDNPQEVSLFKSLLSLLLMGPIEVAAEELAKLRYLGPIREIPGRDYSARQTEGNNWSDGLAAWDALFHDGKALINEVNHWLNGETDSGKERLATGYSVKIAEYKQLALNSQLMGLLQTEDLNGSKKEIERLIEELPVEKGFLLTDKRREVDVSPEDVGIGISQLLPVVVGAIKRDVPILSIEQPEIHIHPGLQVALGDLLIYAAKKYGKSFILETHSEHIMLRLKRRIRETSEDELENEEYSLNPDDVNIVYVECIDDETRMLSIRLDEDGDFIDRWPNGFFGERAEELF